MIGGLHGPANLLNYDDSVWSEYKIGAWLKINDPKTGEPAVRNPFYQSALSEEAARITASSDPNDESSPLQDASMQGLQRRGVHFLSCHTALEEQARQLIKHYNLSEDPETIVRDMLAHTVPHVGGGVDGVGDCAVADRRPVQLRDGLGRRCRWSESTYSTAVIERLKTPAENRRGYKQTMGANRGDAAEPERFTIATDMTKPPATSSPLSPPSPYVSIDDTP